MLRQLNGCNKRYNLCIINDCNRKLTITSTNLIKQISLTYTIIHTDISIISNHSIHSFVVIIFASSSACADTIANAKKG